MKFPKIKSVTMAVTFCFVFYSICGCGPTREIQELNKYDALPYKSVITVNAPEVTAYGSAIRALKKQGYYLTSYMPQSGSATLERTSQKPIPEDQKKMDIDDPGPSVGTIILVALAIILVVGIVILLLSSSSDDSKKDEKKNKDNSGSNVKHGRIDKPGSDANGSTGVTHMQGHNDNSHSDYSDNRHHERTNYAIPFFYSFFENAMTPSQDEFIPTPLPDPTYKYHYEVSLTTNPVNDSLTEIELSSEKTEYDHGFITKTDNGGNKYLNYSIFDAIEKEIGKK